MLHRHAPLPSFARRLSGPALLLALAASAGAGEVYSKPPSASGGLNTSSWVAPDGSDADMYAWDDFTLSATETIGEVRWRGGYAYGAPYGRATDFRVSFFASVAGEFQPLIVALPEHEDQEITIATFHTGDNAGETFAGVFGNVAMYDYHFVLPAPVTLMGGVKYWLRVVASQPGYPDWGMTSSPVGDGSYFRYSTGLHMFHNVPHNLAFSLHTSGWEDLGHALPGTDGLPQLAGSGTLAGGSSNTLTLRHARPSSPALLVLGRTSFHFPAHGFLRPRTPVLFVPLSTDASGGASWSFVQPAGVAAGTPLFAQAWIRDPLAARGWAASNVVSSRAP
ncbi:MAG TPA: hypothetical protein VF530_10785 [Planctomycetota bacterium]